MNNSTNATNNGTFPLEPLSIYDIYRTELVTFLTLVVLVNAFGVFANGLIFLATILYPPLRQSSSCILMAHCILIDFMMSLYVGPTMALTTYMGRYQWPAWVCPTWGATMMTNLFTTNWAHAMLAVNRFVASVLPHHYKWCTRKVVLRCGVAFPWLVMIGTNVFLLARIGVYYGQTKPWGGCTFLPSATAVSTVGIYTPCALVGACYVVILAKARWSLRGRVGVPGKRSPLEKRYEVAKMLFGCFIWYCVANYGVMFGLTVVPHLVGPKTILALKAVCYVCSALNPVIFLMVSGDYRAGSMAVLQGKFWRTSSAGVTSENNPNISATTSDTRQTAGKRADAEEKNCA